VVRFGVGVAHPSLILDVVCGGERYLKVLKAFRRKIDFVCGEMGSRATVKTRIIKPFTRTLELPLLVRFGIFFPVSFASESRLFGVSFAHFPEEEEMLDYLLRYCE